MYNGKNGAPVYFAYNKKVYDVTNSYHWQNGNHQVRHNAGQDLTEYLKDAPHGDDLLNKCNNSLEMSVSKTQ